MVAGRPFPPQTQTAAFILDFTTKLGSHCEDSLGEVVLSLGLSDSLESSLVLGESLSQGLGLSGSQVQRSSPEGVLGAVLGVESSEGGLGLEGGSEGVSVLLVDDGQGSGDGLSDDLL